MQKTVYLMTPSKLNISNVSNTVHDDLGRMIHILWLKSPAISRHKTENYDKSDLRKKREFRLDSSGSEKEARVVPREKFNRFLGSKQEGRLDD
jgi:hypothetical protein